MFCNKCGANLPDDSAFCNVCGKPVNGKKKKKPLGIALIIVGIIVVLISVFLVLEATGVTEVTGWFESEPSERKESKREKDGDIECEYPAPDYGYDYYDDEYDEYDYDDYYEEYDADEYDDYYDEYGYEDAEEFFGNVDFHEMADFFGAFGNGYDYDDYFTPPAPVEEEEHTQSYYDGYGDGYY